ncbi:hypothetical protein EXIGLDRAFT_612857 [Exidia glandulosa HHB12029]|uniref:DNA breaking-rejoining enzyme n=1 Tax=Exidia glandulosa HHB12029 TaxID=1314781 RepID=A0A165IJN8_EXIGL|nr:hypothetical protein EXIGLDRAFT_612857 [Exidia glandulosa HHB12029]
MEKCVPWGRCIWAVTNHHNRCDDQYCNGQAKPQKVERSTYGHAQKIRAAMTHHFGREPTIGNSWWTLREDGSVFGNPSLSHLVSTYMVSLRRRKTRAGEAPLSARAITPDVLRKLHDFNHMPENWNAQSYAPTPRGQKNETETTSPAGRRILQAVYTIAFACLMRIDEVLNIRVRHVKALIDSNGEEYMMLTLDFRKTNQNGGVKPFCLYRFPAAEAHLCPYRAVSDWVEFSQIHLAGDDTPLFPRLMANGRWQVGSQMTGEHLLELMRRNLADVNIDALEYGTHSFRRGGCQWLSCDKRWPLRQICDWGGWSTEFSSLTIVKYLISENDDPRERREDYFNPNRPPALRCFACGRTCSCS